MKDDAKQGDSSAEKKSRKLNRRQALRRLATVAVPGVAAVFAGASTGCESYYGDYYGNSAYSNYSNYSNGSYSNYSNGSYSNYSNGSYSNYSNSGSYTDYYVTYTNYYVTYTNYYVTYTNYYY